MAAPYAPPPVPPRQRRRGGVVGPLILIFLGAVFLLQNTGVLPPNFWLSLWRLWPLVLVLIGIELLLAHRLPWLALLGLAAVVLVLGAAALSPGLWTSVGPGRSQTATSTSSIQTNLNGATQAAISVRFGAGDLNLGALTQPQPDELASMNYTGPPQLLPQPRYTTSSGGVGQLDYAIAGQPRPGLFPFGGSADGESARMDLGLATNVPITSLSVQTGAAQAQLDLAQLHVSTVDLSIGAATAWVRFPSAAGLTTAHISGGASTLTIEIPSGVAAQIQHQGGLSTLDVDQSRFPEVSSNLFRSPDYDSAANKLDLTIETGVTSIQIS